MPPKELYTVRMTSQTSGTEDWRLLLSGACWLHLQETHAQVTIPLRSCLFQPHWLRTFSASVLSHVDNKIPIFLNFSFKL